MKVSLAVLVGALFVVVASGKSCYNYKCVESYEHCKKVTKCEEPKKVQCGEEYCTYPDVCEHVTKKICQDVTTYEKACESAKVCKEVLTECGDEKCKYDEECTVKTICDIIDAPHGSSKASASASAVALSYGSGDDDDDGASAHASATAIANGGSWIFNPIKVCKDIHTCTPKEPCKELTAVACVGDSLEEGHNYDGYSFVWKDDWKVGYKCGKDFCEPGHKCAIIKSKACPEGDHCGDDVCDLGYECVDDVACKKTPVTKTVCQNVSFPYCLKSDVKYEPVCKTVWECLEDIRCGKYSCKAGYACQSTRVSCRRGGSDSSDGGSDDGSDD